ncbi:MAG TPA: signal peptidase II [candidate division Zixibacteria bacterium]|nr:signal peptidase II [candidate division Zixibacteria bacterium]
MLNPPPTDPQADATPPAPAPRSYFRPALALALLVALIDQLSKFWVIERLADAEPVNALGDFLRLTLIYNYGGALGTNFGGPTVYLLMGLLIFLFLIYYTWSHRHVRWFALALGLIAGGAIGNLTDRIRLGKVVDWIDVDFVDINLFGYQIERWWTFNIADAAITLSLAFLLWCFLWGPASHSHQLSDENADNSSDTEPLGLTKPPTGPENETGQ